MSGMLVPIWMRSTPKTTSSETMPAKVRRCPMLLEQVPPGHSSRKDYTDAAAVFTSLE
jgi:hypothetical protein